MTARGPIRSARTSRFAGTVAAALTLVTAWSLAPAAAAMGADDDSGFGVSRRALSSVGHAYRKPDALRMAENTARSTGALKAKPQADRVVPATPAPVPAPVPATPPAPTAAAVWIDNKGQPAGPLDEASLRQRIEAGALSPQTLVWMNGMPGWQPASNVPAVAALFGKAAPVAPVPNVAATAASDPAAFMLGDWTTEGEDEMQGLGPVTIRLGLRYQRGGTASASGTIQPRGRPGLPVQLSATWTATPIEPGRFSFSYKGSMTVYPGNGQAPEVQPIEQTTMVEILDPDTIRIDGDSVQRRVKTPR